MYCKDTKRRRNYEHTSFDFLGYTFRGRLAKGRRGFFMNFSPAMSAKAKKAKGKQIRDWHLNRRSGTDLSGPRPGHQSPGPRLDQLLRSLLSLRVVFLAKRIDEHLVRWAMQKFKRLRGKPQLAWDRLREQQQRNPRLFAHWHLLAATPNRPARAG